LTGKENIVISVASPGFAIGAVICGVVIGEGRLNHLPVWQVAVLIASLSLLAIVLVALRSTVVGALSIRDCFFRWPANEVTRFDYQAEPAQFADRVDELPKGAAVAVAGLSVHSMDGPHFNWPLVATPAMSDSSIREEHSSCLVAELAGSSCHTSCRWART
jgi:hypothetical protein